MGRKSVRPGAAVTAQVLPGQRRYWRMPEGSITVRGLSSDEAGFTSSMSAPSGGVELDAAEGEQALAAARATIAAHAAEVKAEAAATRAADHSVLVALGVPLDVAARLTGHRPAAGAT